MSDQIMEAALQKITGAAAGAIASIVPGALGTGVRIPEIREIGIFNVSGVAAEIGIGYPAALGTGGITTSATVQDISNFGATGATKLVTAYTTLQPTAPTNFMRRLELQAAVGAGIIFTWNSGEWRPWVGATINAPVIWQLSALAVTYDVYIKVAE